MRRLFTILFLMAVHLSWAQVETNTMNNSVEEKELEEAPQPVLDTTVLEQVGTKDVQYKKKNSKPQYKQREESKGAVSKMADSDKAADEMQVQSQQMQVARTGFQYSKTQASTQRSQRSPTPAQQVQMDEAVGYFEANSPNTFEYHYFKYVAGNYDVSLIDHLNEAEKLRPNNADVHVQQASYCMIMDKEKEGVAYIDKLVKADRLQASVLDYAEDLLISAPDGGVLITHGFDDTYASWYLQKKKKIRSDVQLISLDLLQSEAYKKELKSKGFKLPKNNTIDVDYLKEFCSLNATKKLSISLTTPKEYFTPIKDKLYVVGLVFEYHNDSYTNFSRNADLWNNQLKKHLIKDATDSKGKQLSSNYLPMMLQLRSVYETSNNSKEVKSIDKAIDEVSVQCKKYEQVQKLKKAY